MDCETERRAVSDCRFIVVNRRCRHNWWDCTIPEGYRGGHLWRINLRRTVGAELCEYRFSKTSVMMDHVDQAQDDYFKFERLDRWTSRDRIFVDNKCIHLSSKVFCFLPGVDAGLNEK